MPWEITRREALATTLAACAAPAIAAPLSSAPSLKALAQRSGRRFGSAVAWGPPRADRGSFANSAYAAILERECNLLVPENELKWQWTRPSAGTFRFEQFDQIANYAT